MLQNTECQWWHMWEELCQCLCTRWSPSPARGVTSCYLSSLLSWVSARILRTVVGEGGPSWWIADSTAAWGSIGPGFDSVEDENQTLPCTPWCCGEGNTAFKRRITTEIWFVLATRYCFFTGARCSSVVGVFTHRAMGRRIDPSWGGLIELFLVPGSAPRLV